MEESMAEADRILREAGWTPVRMVVTADGVPLPNNSRFAFDNLVCGHPPPGATATYAGKELSKIPQALAEQLGLDPADYPDEHHEAAAWLVAAFPVIAPEAEPILEEPHAVPESQEAHDPASETQSSVDSGDASSAGGDDGSAEAGGASGGREVLAHDGSAWEGDSDPEVDYEADYEEVTEELGSELLDDLPALTDEQAILEGGDPWAQTPETPAQDRFIGLDDLDRRRSLRIGDVIRYANALMPAWALDDDARLSSLRNFTMGVQENRWPDDAAKRNDLEALEGTLRLINQIKAARDAKVVFLEGASREEVEDFSVEADWP